MLTLYYKPTCPYSQRVLAAAEDANITLNLKDISNDEAVKNELIALGGKKQVPYFVDSERGEAMYESNDIVAYLGEHYGGRVPQTFAGLRIHRNDETCDVCE